MSDNTQEHRDDADFLQEIEDLRKEIAAEQSADTADEAADTPSAAAKGTASSVADDSAADDEPTEEESAKDAELRSTIHDLRRFTSDDSEDKSSNGKSTLYSILGGDILVKPWFRRQFFFILMLVVMAFIYINNRYAYQQKMIEQRALNDTLLDYRFKALTRSSQLKERMRRSHIEEALTDTTLQTANTPSFNLKVDEE